MFDPKAACYVDPVLVAATDGVGTKLRIAIDTGKLDGIGQDLVAMCVNDLVCQGAEPLFFLDYFATGKLSIDEGAQVVESIAKGCKLAGCALIGGETAEMPGMYHDGDFDLAGFAVGAMQRGTALPANVREGDVLLALGSDGVHSNGYSLVRKVAELSGLDWDATAPFADNMPLGEALLVPTRIYVESALKAIRAGGVHAIAHITGGGITEYLPRVLPKDLGVHVQLNSWTLPPVFKWLAEAGGIGQADMLKTFNCGIGMVLVVAGDRADELAELLTAADERVYRIGHVVSGHGVSVDGTFA